MFDALTPDAKVLQGRAFAMLLAGALQKHGRTLLSINATSKVIQTKKMP